MAAIKLACGLLSIGITVLGYTLYLRKSLKPNNVIQPHPFSWFIWALVTGVTYFVQRNHGGGAGSWVSALTSVTCFVIAATSFKKNHLEFEWTDWTALVLAFVAIGIYREVRDPTWAAVVATIADAFGYVSTVKKGWKNPESDSVSSFALNAIKFIPSIFAMNVYSIATVLYPSSLIVLNGGVAVMLRLRRDKLASSLGAQASHGIPASSSPEPPV